MTDLTSYAPGKLIVRPEDPEISFGPDLGSELIMRAVGQMDAAYKLAQALATTAFVPAHFRGKPDDVTAAIMYGAAIGLDPMSSLRAIYVVGGNPGMYARQMVAVVLSKGHRVWTEEETDTSVTVAGQRRGSETVERVTWDIERAKLAGYVPTTDPKTGRYRTNDKGKVIGNEKYLTEPRTMLYARAAGDLARRIAPDALAGLDYAVEELQVIDHVDVTPTTQERPRRESAASLLTQTPQGAAPSGTTQGAPTPGAVEVEGADVGASDAPPPAGPPAETPVLMVTKAQLAKIAAQMRDLDITERDHALGYIEKAIGLKIASRSELTREEAKRLIDALDEDIAQANGNTDGTTSSPDGNAEA